MQITLEYLKQKKICSILPAMGWKYTEDDSPKTNFFNYCIKESLAWYCRRGKKISYEVLCSVATRLAVAKDVDRLELVKTQSALKSFTNSSLYSKIEDPLVNVEAHLCIKNGHVIKHMVPSIVSMPHLKNGYAILTADNKIRNKEDLMQSYETKLIAIWSFYNMNKYATFYNLYLEDNKVESIRFRPNQFFIMDAKNYFNRMVNLIEENKPYPAPLEVCIHCARRSECPMTRIKNKKEPEKW